MQAADNGVAVLEDWECEIGLCKPLILEVEARSNWSRKVPHGRQYHKRFNELLSHYEHEAFKPEEKPVDQNQANQERHRESF